MKRHVSRDMTIHEIASLLGIYMNPYYMIDHPIFMINFLYKKFILSTWIYLYSRYFKYFL